MNARLHSPASAPLRTAHLIHHTSRGDEVFVVEIEEILRQLGVVLFDADDSDVAEIEVRREDGSVLYFGLRPFDPGVDL